MSSKKSPTIGKVVATLIVTTIVNAFFRGWFLMLALGDLGLHTSYRTSIFVAYLLASLLTPVVSPKFERVKK